MSITLRAVAFDCTECDSTESSPGAASPRSMLSISPIGRLVYVGGRLHKPQLDWSGRRWRLALEIIPDEIQFLTPKPYRVPAAAAA